MDLVKFRITFTFLVSGIFWNSCGAFLQTSPFLAWSDSPGTRLADSIFNKPPLEPAPEQLELKSSTAALCPSGYSSLLIFFLSGPDHRLSFEKALLPQKISESYNSASVESRAWIRNMPNNLGEKFLYDVAVTWPANCQGDVIVKEVRQSESIASAYLDAVKQSSGPNLVVLTTIPVPELNILWKRQIPSLSRDTTKAKPPMPSAHSGVFWRYSFLSDYFVVAVLVFVLLFVLPVSLGLYALTSVETPKGLRTKMVGAIAEVKVR